MNDCPNALVRDLLPDWGAGTLGPAEHAMVAAHLETCADCRDEVELLAAVRRARPIVPAVDVARIVAALPPAPRAGVIPLRPRAAPAWRSWRAAAAAVAVVVGGSVVALQQRGDGAGPAPGEVADVRALPGPAGTPAPRTDTTPAAAPVAAATETPLLAMVDEAGDLSPDDYDALVSQLEQETQLFTPVVDGAADPLGGGFQ